MQTPHSYRRMAIHSWFVILLGIIIAMAFLMSCSPQNGCRATKGMAGYSWIKCVETKKVFILNKEGAIVCTYIDNKN